MTTLFGATADLSPETVNAEVVKAMVCGYKDPRTMDYINDPEDVLFDAFCPGNAITGEITFHPDFGTFTTLAEWGGSKDETPVGLVIHHEETGKDYLCTGTYSSWDGPHYSEVVEAEEYTYTEQRWRGIDG